MRDIEAQNQQLAGVLPKTYQIFDNMLLKGLLKRVGAGMCRQSRGLHHFDRHRGHDVKPANIPLTFFRQIPFQCICRLIASLHPLGRCYREKPIPTDAIVFDESPSLKAFVVVPRR
jgi:hypothetical protein